MVGGTCFGGVCGPAPTVEGASGLFFAGVSVMAESGDRSYRTCICRSPEVCGGLDGWLQVPGALFIPGSNVTMASTPASAGETFSLTVLTTVTAPVYAWAVTLVPAPSLCSGPTSDFDLSLSDSGTTSATFLASPTTQGKAGLWHVCVCLTFLAPNEAGELPPCEDFTLAGSVDVRPQSDTYALHGAVVAPGMEPEVWTVTGGAALSFSVLGASPGATVAAAESEEDCHSETFLSGLITSSTQPFSVQAPVMDGDFLICVKDPLHCD